MSEQNPTDSSATRRGEEETPLVSRSTSPRTAGSRSGGKRQPRQTTAEPKRVGIVLRIAPVESQQSEPPKPVAETPTPPALSLPPSQDANLQTPKTPETSEHKTRTEAEPQQIPARMLNEFVYCQRLFYYEFVEGVFVESVDTLRGGAIHQRVDSGSGALPKAKGKSEADKPKEGTMCLTSLGSNPRAFTCSIAANDGSM